MLQNTVSIFIRRKFFACVDRQVEPILISVLLFQSTNRSLAVAMGLDEDFQAAVDAVSNKINKTMSNEELLEVYALYKQASVGDCNTSRPGMMDFKVRHGNISIIHCYV